MVSVAQCYRLTVLAGWLFTACSNSSFKSQVPAEEAALPTVVPEETTVLDSAPESTSSTIDAAGRVSDKHQLSLKVDVVFAIDTSGSMDDELKSTQSNLQKMITTLSNGRLDANIHLMLDEPFAFPPGTDAKRAAIIQQHVDSTDAISRLINLFSGLYAANYLGIDQKPLAAPLAFRKDAKLEVVVITDDNGDGAGNLAADFNANKSIKATFNGIIALPTSVPSATCTRENVGNEYLSLAKQTMGSSLDICSVDWSGLITRLSTDMIKRSLSFPLSRKPLDPKAIQVSFGEQKLAPEDWSYAADSNSITLIKTDGIKDGAALTLSYLPAN